MPISGLVILLDSDETDSACAFDALRHLPELELGDQVGPRIAAVAVTPSTSADRALIDQIRALQGVRNVDVVFVEVSPAVAEPGLHHNSWLREVPR
ncbi:MAG: hypothetical protein H6811_10700 [Phycisphaeraceae bacterium]|nr:hypothetical protein [Phycisphaeraceae bacterium]